MCRNFEKPCFFSAATQPHALSRSSRSGRNKTKQPLNNKNGICGYSQLFVNIHGH
jgi:hypothetical protein